MPSVLKYRRPDDRMGLSGPQSPILANGPEHSGFGWMGLWFGVVDGVIWVVMFPAMKVVRLAG